MTSAGGWTTPLLNANSGSYDLRMEVTPGAGVTQAVNTQFIGVSSASDPTKEDVVEASTSTTLAEPPVTLQSLTLNPTSVVGGNTVTGRVTLTGAAPAGGLRVNLFSDNTQVAAVPAAGYVDVAAGATYQDFSLSTTAVTATTPVVIQATHGDVVKEVTLRVTPRFEITNISNGDVLSGFMWVNVAVYDKTIRSAELTFNIDGTFYDWCKPAFDPSTNSLMSVSIATHGLSNGSHVLSVSDSAGNSDNRTVTFQNDISQLNFAAIFDVSPGVTDVPSACQITATVESGSSWTVTIKDDSDNPIRTFTGSGTSISVTWDGTSDAGVMQPEGNYQLFFSTATMGLMSSKSRTTSRRRVVPRRPTKTRGGTRLNAASDGGSSSSFDYPLGITNKHKFSDSLVVIDTSMWSTLTEAKNYAKFIRAQISNKIFQTFAYPCYPILVGPGGYSTHMATAERIKHELELPKKLIYIMSHGVQDPAPVFLLAGRNWHSAGTNATFTPPMSAKDIKLNMNVSQLVAPLGYGEDMDPPKLVWIDTCNSAGGASATEASADPSDERSGPYYGGGLRKEWANCFGIDPANGFEGVFLGVSGYSQVAWPEPFTWADWRRELWSCLMFENRNFEASYSHANVRTPNPYADDLNPQDRYRWWGIGTTAF